MPARVPDGEKLHGGGGGSLGPFGLTHLHAAFLHMALSSGAQSLLQNVPSAAGSPSQNPLAEQAAFM